MIYAAYGSNLHPLRLAARIHSARLLGTGFLEAWSLEFHKRGQDASAKCNIVTGGDGVHLALYEISRPDKAILDGIEGLGRGYVESRIDVPGFGECVTYLAGRDWIDESLAPFDWYKALVERGAGRLGFPAAYRARIAALEARRDPDPARRAANRRLLNLL